VTGNSISRATETVNYVGIESITLNTFTGNDTVNITNPAAVTINPFPSLKISHSGPDIRLSWPLWASNFVLQQASDVRPAAAAWSNLPASVIITNGEYVVALPLSAPSKLYRLYLP
jgi:hypothetical protein